MSTAKYLRFIDLFAGMGGFRLGFEQACVKTGYRAQCVFTSEIKPHAITVYKDNFPSSDLHGDITQINAQAIPDFDVLLAGFPCQAFSCAGKRYGFADTRGTLFFEIERILQAKRPAAFILENVEGLVGHDKEPNSSAKVGRTLSIILEKLQQLGYQVTWQVLDAQHFGLAQSRKRIFIVGHLEHAIDLQHFPRETQTLKAILQQGQACMESKLSRLLLENYSLAALYGKSVKDKRGGSNNIHSWDLGLKGKISTEQKRLLNLILLYRRNKKWAEQKGIQWMDGMPLTLAEIKTFYQHPELQTLLQDLVAKNYLKFEYPKDIVLVQENGKSKQVRMPRTDIEKGYNIVAGKLSYEISKILDPNGIAPTLVATDLDRVVVPDEQTQGLRKLTLIEQSRLFGFPDDFKLNIKPALAHDLFGNTVPVKVVTAVATLLIRSAFSSKVSGREPKPLRTKLVPPTTAFQSLALP